MIVIFTEKIIRKRYKIINIYVFPYRNIKKGEKIVIAGGGVVGTTFVNEIVNNNYCEIVGIVDKAYKEKNEIKGIKVASYETLKDMQYDHIVIAVTPQNLPVIVNELMCVGISLSKCVMNNYASIDPIEALMIQEIFKLLQMEKIRYIDVGACHPHIDSNTMTLYRKGSRGVNIEPQESLKGEFEIYRPEDINLFMGVGALSGKAMFYKAKNPYLSTFSTVGKKYSEEHHNASYEDNEVVIELITLNEIVDTYFNGVFPELLDIDIEGMDEEVLEAVDFSKSSPLVICAEGSTIRLNRILMDKECEAGGYLPYCRIACNTIYLRKDIYKKILCV